MGSQVLSDARICTITTHFEMGYICTNDVIVYFVLPFCHSRQLVISEHTFFFWLSQVTSRSERKSDCCTLPPYKPKKRTKIKKTCNLYMYFPPIFPRYRRISLNNLAVIALPCVLG